jgi:predicted ester cyclase
MSAESNKTLVRRYFEQVLDQRNLSLLDRIAAADCVIHRPEAAQPIQGRAAFKAAIEAILQTYSAFSTTIHEVVAEGDKVVCRLTHEAVNAGSWASRLGTHAVAGKPVSWEAIVIFRMRDGQIAEEWVSRDELGMLIQLGALARLG